MTSQDLDFPRSGGPTVASGNGGASDTPERGESRHLATLEHLLAIEALDMKSALEEASTLVAEAMGAEKVDIFLCDVPTNTLVALGVSFTPMAKRQLELGLNRLPIANGGRVVSVFTSGKPFLTGHADHDPEELPGIINELGVRSTVSAPLFVNGDLRGVVQANSPQRDAFNEQDLRFIQAVSGWVGTIAHRAELVELLRRDTHDEARRMAAEELVTIIAHDLGNYLTPLMGRAQILHMQATREGQQNYVQHANEITAVLRRLDRMVRTLLDVSRLEENIFTLHKKRVEVVGLVRGTADSLATPDCPIEVKEYREVWAEIDPERLRQALENLMSNAVKHSPDGAVVRVVVADEERQDGAWVTIRVIDQGPGISADMMPRLFSRFAPGPNSTGLGLGLYLAQSIIRAHGGTLSAESEPGKGATFVLEVPAASDGSHESQS
jgi:two-component system, OmpR family, sensor kinase